MTREEILSIEEYCAEHKVSSSSNASFPYTRKIHQTVQAGRGKEREQSYHRSSDPHGHRYTYPGCNDSRTFHASAVARHMVSMFANGLKISSKDSRQKKTLTNYHLVTGRHYPPIAGDSCYYQQLAATNGYNLPVAANCYIYVLLRMLTKKTNGGGQMATTALLIVCYLFNYLTRTFLPFTM